MLKTKKIKTCPCGSGQKFLECCGDSRRLAAHKKPCGDCSACCELMGVQELGKPYGVNCNHQCAAGCAIYANRPQSCRDFLCVWKIVPDMPLEMRPDKSGIMYHIDLLGDGKGTLALFICETYAGSFDNLSDLCQEWVNYQCESGQLPVVFVPYGLQMENAYEIAEEYRGQIPNTAYQIQSMDGRVFFARQTQPV